jgi:hypothetical protein
MRQVACGSPKFCSPLKSTAWFVAFDKFMNLWEGMITLVRHQVVELRVLTRNLFNPASFESLAGISVDHVGNLVAAEAFRFNRFQHVSTHKSLKRLVDVRGFEPLTPCLQTRFQTLLKSMKFCGFEAIDNEPIASCLLKLTEALGPARLLQLQIHLQRLCPLRSNADRIQTFTTENRTVFRRG